MVGLKAERMEAGKDDRNAQRNLDLILETLGSHGKSLSRGVTSHLAFNAATLKAEGTRNWQTGNKRNQGRAWWGSCPGWSWRDKDLNKGGKGICQAWMASWIQKLKSVPGGQQDGL